jgi:hypothetical protein
VGAKATLGGTMNLDKINQWITLLANVGVLIGIVFLALEMRHSSNAVTAQTQDSIADGFISLNMATIIDPEVGKTWVIGLNDPSRLSDTEAIRFSMHMRALFNQFRRVHGLYRAGLLEESNWALYAREAATIMTSPGGKLHWAGNEMDDEFRADIVLYVGQESNVEFMLGRDSQLPE